MNLLATGVETIQHPHLERLCPLLHGCLIGLSSAVNNVPILVHHKVKPSMHCPSTHERNATKKLYQQLADQFSRAIQS